ncbi:hypothetical protein CVH10_23535, partial [Halomonas sp. ND22Bw]|uniref:RHS repeat-associated core domain-containing protein n=1 Tax=Halomonas sp. ND22Bw TaxID=2054178 RepID=UPI000D2911ED
RPIRFQGQWEDQETGLSYNQLRHYDVLVGQYASPDPIGIGGGFRLHGYVALPNSEVDPFGLAPVAYRMVGTRLCIVDKFPS